MEYFKHDINASEDDKICELLAEEGYEMLGYYWRFVEYLYNRGGKVNKAKLNSVAWTLHMDSDKLSRLVTGFGLFCEDEKYIYSQRVANEIEEFEAVGRRMSEIGKAGGKASAKAKAQACGKRTVKRAVSDSSSDDQANAQQNKIKENKINKNKKENKEKNSSSLSGILPDGFFYHPNSGEKCIEVDGVLYDEDGNELNDAGYKIIDFELRKSDVMF